LGADIEKTFFRWAGMAVACVALAACGGGNGEDGGGSGSPPPVGTPGAIGPAGGTVSGPGGAAVAIPAGALATPVAVQVAQTSQGALPLPAGLVPQGPMFAFTPHGTVFALPVVLTVPFDPSQTPAGATPQLYKTNAQGQWEPVPAATFGATSVTAQVTGFSHVQVVTPPLQRNDPLREWAFSVYPTNGLVRQLLPGTDGFGTQTGGLLDKVVEFGEAPLDNAFVGNSQSFPADGKANGMVISTASGITYSVFAEAPYNRAVDGAGPIGARTKLKQFQSFVKRAADARLTYTVTSVELIVEDYNTRADPSRLISAETMLAVGAYKTSVRHFYMASATSQIRGRGNVFVSDTRNESFSRVAILDDADFDMSLTDVSYQIGNGSCPGKRGRFKLKRPRTYTVDLSSVAVGETFTLRIDTHADALNRRGGEPVGDCQASYAVAYLRDPQDISGTTLEFSGLEPSNEPVLPPPPFEQREEPLACPAPNPTAGTLQFSAPAFAVGEEEGATQTVTVTRSGGSSGAVTATLASNDGSARSGVDYTALRATVFFGDGDTQPRRVTLPIIPNLIGAQFNRTVNLVLSEPGNCATIGALANTVVSIVDDDPVPPGLGLDPSFGTLGEAVLSGFGGTRSSMGVQPDGKVVMAGGSLQDFILARFNADGSIDRDFGFLGDGTVTTDMGSGLIVEEATAVAIQADGKIVVAGYTATDNRPPVADGPVTFALARYNADGRLDTTFGNGGRVSGVVLGFARAVVIQPDGHIVVAGEVTFGDSFSPDNGDVVLARYRPDGTFDPSFGITATGQITRDLGGSTNAARNIVLQRDGKIVVSGTSVDNVSGVAHTDVARFLPNGEFDDSFGNRGKVRIATLAVGEGLALQSDDKLVLVGSVVQNTFPASARFVVQRLLANGTPDPGFGAAGKVDVALSSNAKASAVAVQADDKIVVVGTTALVSVSRFMVARYNTNGTLDGSFGNGGSLDLNFFSANNAGENIAVMADGRIVVSGMAENASGAKGYGVARLLP
jgi:uncharacterized delta-60 repeat protein